MVKDTIDRLSKAIQKARTPIFGSVIHLIWSYESLQSINFIFQIYEIRLYQYLPRASTYGARCWGKNQKDEIWESGAEHSMH